MSVTYLDVTEEEDGMRLDRWFKRRLPKLSLSHLNKIVRKGEVRVDGKRCETATRLASGNKIRIPPLDPAAAPTAEKPIFKPNLADARAITDMVLYEDDDLMVLNKPYGLAVQGGSGMRQHIDGMLEALTNAKGERPRLVHRLDRETSGVLLVAKKRKIAARLGEIFASRQARKIYWSVAAGVPKPLQGRISLFLAKGDGMETRPTKRDDVDRARMEKMRIAKHGEKDAQHSITYYTVVDKAAPRLSWLSMKPITGRTHQLRAHAEAIGHPMIGDSKYSGPKPTGSVDPMRAIPETVERKLHLLARRIILPHPSGGTLDVTAPLPPHMQKTFDLFGWDISRHDSILEAPE